MVDNPDFTPSQVGGLFTFLARQLAKPDNTLFVNRKLFDQVTSQLSYVQFRLFLNQAVLKAISMFIQHFLYDDITSSAQKPHDHDLQP